MTFRFLGLRSELIAGCIYSDLSHFGISQSPQTPSQRAMILAHRALALVIRDVFDFSAMRDWVASGGRCIVILRVLNNIFDPGLWW